MLEASRCCRLWSSSSVVILFTTANPHSLIVTPTKPQTRLLIILELTVLTTLDYKIGSPIALPVEAPTPVPAGASNASNANNASGRGTASGRGGITSARGARGGASGLGGGRAGGMGQGGMPAGPLYPIEGLSPYQNK